MNKSVFCDEPILAAFRGTRNYDDMIDATAFFDYYHDLAYHITQGERIVLETEQFYLSIDACGVTKDRKTASLADYERPGEWLDPYIHFTGEDEPLWIDYESTLFVGERLLSVEKQGNIFLLTFDDFVLKVVPHVLGDPNFPSLCNQKLDSFNHVLGSDRHLKRLCDCGGKGELLMDFVCDYVVRCTKCHRSTWAQMTAQEAVEEWNDGAIECDLSDITIE